MKEITIKQTDNFQTLEEKVEILRKKINELVKFCNKINAESVQEANK